MGKLLSVILEPVFEVLITVIGTLLEALVFFFVKFFNISGIRGMLEGDPLEAIKALIFGGICLGIWIMMKHRGDLTDKKPENDEK